MTVAAETRRIGTFRALGRAWFLWVPIVLVTAAAQGIMIAFDPTPGLDATAIALAILSLLVVIAAGHTLLAAVSAGHSSDVRATFSALLRRRDLLGWVAVFAAAAVVLGILVQPLVLLVVVAAAAVLPRLAERRRAAARVRVILADVLAVIGIVLLMVLAFVVALLLGLFVTGVLASVVTWLWFGLTATVSLSLGTRR